MRTRSMMATTLLAAAALGRAEPVPVVDHTARKAVAVTVYNDDLALVKDTREFDIPAGEHALRFVDVAAKIEPRAVAVRSLTEPEKLSVVEQNYVFDLISPQKLMEKYVGQEVELVETDQELRTQTTKAVLLSMNGGPVYRIGDKIAVGHPGRVILPTLPAELYARPTLLWRLANAGAPKHRIEVSYLTTGLGWSADYVFVVNPDDTRTDVTGWVTLTNQSGARYDDATLKLVAGRVNRAQVPDRLTFAREAMAQRAAAAPKFEEEAFFEYHLYTLDRPATLADNETKQMRLLSASEVPVEKHFMVVGKPTYFRSRLGDLERNLPVSVFLELRNDAASHLGMPLPAGTVRLYKQDKSGAQQLVGEDSIRHTPKDETVRLKVGEAFDVVATRVQTDYREINVKPYNAEAAFRVTIRNHKTEPITVDVREPVDGEWTVVESSLPAKKIDTGTLGFAVPVAKDGEATLTYRVRVAY